MPWLCIRAALTERPTDSRSCPDVLTALAERLMHPRRSSRTAGITLCETHCRSALQFPPPGVGSRSHALRSYRAPLRRANVGELIASHKKLAISSCGTLSCIIRIDWIEVVPTHVLTNIVVSGIVPDYPIDLTSRCRSCDVIEALRCMQVRLIHVIFSTSALLSANGVL